MNNKLDSFNKDKFKCEKCKEYYDLQILKRIIFKKRLCDSCYTKWLCNCNCDTKWFVSTTQENFDDWCKDEQA